MQPIEASALIPYLLPLLGAAAAAGFLAGLFGIGWAIDFWLLNEMVDEANRGG